MLETMQSFQAKFELDFPFLKIVSLFLFHMFAELLDKVMQSAKLQISHFIQLNWKHRKFG